MLRQWKQRAFAGRTRVAAKRSGRRDGPLRQRTRRTFERLEPRLVLDGGPLVISEVLADNEATLADQDGDFPDWIEIHNPTDTTVDLQRWCLTDDDDTPDKWRFPDMDLAPGGYLVVFASGKDLTDPAGELHTNFQLNADGEYLALVQADGVTVSHEYTPKFPFLADDVSYGLFQNTIGLLSGDEPIAYRVPTADDDPTAWTLPTFDDTGWTRTGTEPTILVTEVGIGSPDFVEIQNVSDQTVDTSGWVVALNRGVGGNIDEVHDTLWRLPDSMEPGEVLYRTDMPGDHYFGENISWGSNGTGWVAIVDGGGDLADFVPWRYGNEQIAQMRAEINGFTIRGPSGFTGDGVIPTDGHTTMQRLGSFDHDDRTDFAFVASDRANVGQQNPDLALPVGEGRIAGVGFSDADLPGFGGSLQGNPAGEMLDQNASLWTRMSFDVDDPADLETLSLVMEYNDGFIAYLNGQEVARRNAPDSPKWNATATAQRDVDQSSTPEEIRMTGSLDALVPGMNILAVHGLNVAAGDTDFLLHAELLATHVDQVERYFFAPTPGEPNGTGTPDLGPIIADVGHEELSPEGTVVTARVAATLHGVDQVTLSHRVMFDAEQQTVMRDDGTHGDATAGDGVYSAVIDAGFADPGEMVRYRVTASDTTTVSSRMPLFDDPTNSPEYYGWVVDDPSIETELPILHRFIQNTAAAETRSGTRGTVSYDGEFHDNVFIRMRGGTAAGWPKKSYKIRFNDRHHFRFDPDLPPVDEINVNATYTDKAYVRAVLTSELQNDAGTPSPKTFHVRMHQNGEFFSVAYFVEQPDRDFLRHHDMDPDGAFYKGVGGARLDGGTASFEKQTRTDEDKSDLTALMAGLKLNGDALERFLFDNVNLPAQINFMATNVVAQNIDATDKNYYIYRDTNGSGEWHMTPWDLDLTFGPDALNTDTMVADERSAATPGVRYPNASHPLLGDQAHPLHANKYNALMDRIFDVPRTREMFLRRVRTLTDQFLATTYFHDRIDELVEQLGPDVVLDQARWGGNAHFGNRDYTLEAAAERIKTEYLAPRVSYLTEYHAPGANAQSIGIPAEQAAAPSIEFGAIKPNPDSGNQDEEYIELINPGATSVDLSGWQLMGGVTMTFAPGVVIPAGGSLYVSPDVATFRARTDGPSGGQGLFVQGGYRGQISNLGEVVVLADAQGKLIADVTTPYVPSPVQEFLRVTEVMYHPADPTAEEIDAGAASASDFEFIELTNAGTLTLDLTGVRFTNGVDFEFSGSNVTTLAPGEHVLVVKSLEAFRVRYGTGIDSMIAGVFANGTSLDNGGETIRMEDAGGSTVQRFRYDDKTSEGWYDETDGPGASLVVEDIDGDYDDPANWRPSCLLGGSPGEAEDACPHGDFDNDGDRDVDDVDALTRVGDLVSGVSVTPATDRFDLNADGIVNGADLDRWLATAATFNGLGSPYLRGDANLDGHVDIRAPDGSGDAQVVQSNLGTMSGMAWSDGDFNGDGDVDLWAADGSGDAQVLSSNLGGSLDVGTFNTLSTANIPYQAREDTRSKDTKGKTVAAAVDLLLATDWA